MSAKPQLFSLQSQSLMAKTFLVSVLECVAVEMCTMPAPSKTEELGASSKITVWLKPSNWYLGFIFAPWYIWWMLLHCTGTVTSLPIVHIYRTNTKKNQEYIHPISLLNFLKSTSLVYVFHLGFMLSGLLQLIVSPSVCREEEGVRAQSRISHLMVTAILESWGFPVYDGNQHFKSWRTRATVPFPCKLGL